MTDRTRQTLRYLTAILLVLLALCGVLLMLAKSLAGVAAVVIAAVAVSAGWKWLETRCPHCRKGFSLGTPFREELSRRETELQDSIQYRDDSVRSNFSLDGKTRATQIVCREERTCRRCGKRVTRTVTVIRKNN